MFFSVFTIPHSHKQWVISCPTVCATSEFNVNLSSVYDEGAKETDLAIEGSELALSSFSLDMVQERTLLELQDLFEKLMRDAYEIGLDQSSPPYSQRGRLVQILCRMQISYKNATG